MATFLEHSDAETDTRQVWMELRPRMMQCLRAQRHGALALGWMASCNTCVNKALVLAGNPHVPT